MNAITDFPEMIKKKDPLNVHEEEQKKDQMCCVPFIKKKVLVDIVNFYFHSRCFLIQSGTFYERQF